MKKLLKPLYVFWKGLLSFRFSQWKEEAMPEGVFAIREGDKFHLPGNPNIKGQVYKLRQNGHRRPIKASVFFYE